MIPTFGIWSLEKSFHFLRNMVWTFQCFFGFCFQKYFGMTFVGSYCSFIFSAISFKLYRLYLQFQFSLFYFILVGTLCCSSEKKGVWMKMNGKCDSMWCLESRAFNTHYIYNNKKVQRSRCRESVKGWRGEEKKNEEQTKMSADCSFSTFSILIFVSMCMFAPQNFP